MASHPREFPDGNSVFVPVFPLTGGGFGRPLKRSFGLFCEKAMFVPVLDSKKMTSQMAGHFFVPPRVDSDELQSNSFGVSLCETLCSFACQTKNKPSRAGFIFCTPTGASPIDINSKSHSKPHSKRKPGSTSGLSRLNRPPNFLSAQQRCSLIHR